jgi:RNA polymerase-binding transcription factor DksA
MLTKEDNEKYQSELERERRRLIAEIENEVPADFGSDPESDLEEESDESEDFANKVAIKDTLKARLNEIDMALNRIKTGGYGICAKCGKEIEKDILDLVPESELCSECKKENPGV